MQTIVIINLSHFKIITYYVFIIYAEFLLLSVYNMLKELIISVELQIKKKNIDRHIVT